MKYTWKDVIFCKEQIEEAGLGLLDEVYYADSVEDVLKYANNDYAPYCSTLDSSSGDKFYPFLCNDTYWTFIIPKKKEEPKKTKRVPFDFSKKEDRDALRGRWITFKQGAGTYECQMVGFELTPVALMAYSRFFFSDARSLFEQGIFLDGPDAGQPVGKEVEE